MIFASASKGRYRHEAARDPARNATSSIFCKGFLAQFRISLVPGKRESDTTQLTCMVCSMKAVYFRNAKRYLGWHLPSTRVENIQLLTNTVPKTNTHNLFHLKIYSFTTKAWIYDTKRVILSCQCYWESYTYTVHFTNDEVEEALVFLKKYTCLVCISGTLHNA